ncbi:MAG: hypothetical protein ABEK36_06125 [Candidatus Aenigmatarchaeota archaeon]
MSQYGSQYLATEKDMSWREILRYYYDPIEINKIPTKGGDEEVNEDESVSRDRPKTGQSICNLCGEGIFNLCDRNECNSLGACWFKERNILGLKFFPSCFSCDVGDNKIDTCGDYNNRDSCERDPCYIGDCIWADKYITEKPHCVDTVVYGEYRKLKSKLGDVHLAFHPGCGNNNKLAYKIGEKLKEKMEFYVNEFKMRSDIKCEYKKKTHIPRSFPYWSEGSKNKYLTISLVDSENENKIKYYKNDEFGKQLAIDLFKSFKKADYRINLRAIDCPGTPEICENLYNSTAVSMEIDLSNIGSEKFSKILIERFAG